MASHLEELRNLIHGHPAVSFTHVRRDANKVADHLVNAGVEGELVTLWGPLESFEGSNWAHTYHQLAARDQQGGTQLTRPSEEEGTDASRRVHAMTNHHLDGGQY